MKRPRHRNDSVLPIGKWNRPPGSPSGGSSYFTKLCLYSLGLHIYSLSSQSPVTEQELGFSSEIAIKAALSLREATTKAVVQQAEAEA